MISNFKPITVSHGSAYTVVNATQQVNGKWQFWGCQNSVTREPIDYKFDTRNYVGELTSYAKFHKIRRHKD